MNKFAIVSLLFLGLLTFVSCQQEASSATDTFLTLDDLTGMNAEEEMLWEINEEETGEGVVEEEAMTMEEESWAGQDFAVATNLRVLAQKKK